MVALGRGPWVVDALSRLQGRLLDAVGFGPAESPWRPVARHAAFTLRAYSDPDSPGPVMLIVPAPIKKGYVWDLAPGQSAVRQLVRSGWRVYLVYWEEPTLSEQTGLAEYADRFLEVCLRAIEAESGRSRVWLAGHSLGGTLTAIYALLHPERVAGVVLLASPLQFGPGVDALSRLIAMSPPAALVSGLFDGGVPGWWLDTSSVCAAPNAFLLEPHWDLLVSLHDPAALRSHLRMMRWMLDQTPLTRRLFEEVVEWLYREDRLMQGALTIGGKRVVAGELTAPLLCVAEFGSSVMPGASMRRFFEQAGSRRKRWFWFHPEVGVTVQHAGMLAGRKAHQQLWPHMLAWLSQQAAYSPSL